MAELQHSDVPGRPPGQPRAQGPRTQVPSGRKGAAHSAVDEDFSPWAWFAGGLMVLVGLFQVLTGTVALAGSGYYTVPTRNLVVQVDYTTWGWVHLVLGIVALVVGGGLVLGNAAARVAGIALAGISAVVNLAFLPASPFASALIIGLDVLVIYAITVQVGGPERARR
jgi:hypothetical protein